jgi:hypothetical protein
LTGEPEERRRGCANEASANAGALPLNGARGEKMRDNGKRRCAMGDKGKKDKDKSQKQKMNKQEQKAKRELEKQQKRTP